MYRLIAHTQYCENYGTEESPRWKFKGGSDYVVARLTLDQVVELGQAGMAKLVAEAHAGYTWFNAYTKSYLIDWSILAPGELTGCEQMQLEYDGAVTYPAKELESS